MSTENNLHYITVRESFRVPLGNYCNGENGICEYFDNYGGGHTCDRGYSIPIEHRNYEKSPQCLKLEVINES